LIDSHSYLAYEFALPFSVVGTATHKDTLSMAHNFLNGCFDLLPGDFFEGVTFGQNGDCIDGGLAAKDPQNSDYRETLLYVSYPAATLTRQRLTLCRSFDQDIESHTQASTAGEGWCLAEFVLRSRQQLTPARCFDGRQCHISLDHPAGSDPAFFEVSNRLLDEFG
jgi:hypothetical protein